MNDIIQRYNEAIQKGIPFVLTEEDIKLGINNDGKEIKSIEDLLMVHVTDYLPKGAIKPPIETGKLINFEATFKVNGQDKTFSIPVKNYRNTTHYCLNGIVESHMYGNWDVKKYAILMPLDKNKDKIVGGTECDLFSEGSVSINDTAFILCPQNEMDKMKELNPEAHIVGYSGNNVSPYVNMFLSNVLGYKYKEPTNDSRYWEPNTKDQLLVTNIINENGWIYCVHKEGSKWNHEERSKIYTEELFNTIRLVKDEKILNDTSNIEQVLYYITKSAWYLNMDVIDQFINSDKDEFMQMIYSYYKRYKMYDEIVHSGISQDELEQQLKDNKIDNYNMIDDDIAKSIAKKVIDDLRLNLLREKAKIGNISEIENLEMLCLERNINFEEVKKAYNYDKFKDGLATFDVLKNKDMSALSNEEIEKIFSVINFELNVINSEDNKIKFSLKQYDSSENLDSNRNAVTAAFDDTLNPGFYLFMSLMDKDEILSKLSGKKIDKKLYELATSREEYLKNVKEYSIIPELHVLDNIPFRDLLTDCDLSKCRTVKDLYRVVMNYSELMKRQFHGEKVIFDKYGNEEIKKNEEEDYFGFVDTDPIEEEKFEDYVGFSDTKPKDDTSAMEYMPHDMTDIQKKSLIAQKHELRRQQYKERLEQLGLSENRILDLMKLFDNQLKNEQELQMERDNSISMSM